ncbi:hypothetical protein ACFO5R_01910 [Halosolutus amylolyticus]|uniref:DUF7978 domain-containing protein n=1 Tax=Halosolutus amylolyticus TaxID=2932267 RepID=A0ABD5PK17_9EURY|nr:hypothetical protein [Halosolutus amylolyticus]
MSSESHLEYDTGPPLDDESDTESGSDRTETDAEPESPDDGETRQPSTTVSPWVAGLCSGAGAFAIVFAVIYHLVGSMFAAGAFARMEEEPSQVAIAGLSTLGSHGASIEQGGEQIQSGFATYTGLTSHVTTLIPIIVLALSGYLLVRYVRLETRAEAGQVIGSMGAAYVALAMGLAQVATWTPEDEPVGATGDASQIAVPVDAGTVLTLAVTVFVFAGIGAAIAALPRWLERDRASADDSDPA